MKTGSDQVLIKVRNPKVEKRGSIHMRTDIDEDQHHVTNAVVIAIPRGMSKNRYLMIPKTIPLEPYGIQWDRVPKLDFKSDQEEMEFLSFKKVFHSEEREMAYSYSDILREVEVGDKIYFNWTALANKRNQVPSKNLTFQEIAKFGNLDIDWKNDQIWKVDYGSIYCAIRDTKVIMIGSYCLIEPDMESYEDILLPVYYPIEITGGKKVPKPKSEWIQMKVEPEAKALRGFVRAVGSPFKGEECYVKPGDHILYENGSKLTVNIEGKKYLAIRQHRLMGVIEKNAPHR